MPEGDTIFRAARTLHRALAGQTVTTFETVLPRLSRIHEDHPITGRTIERVTSAGKWLMIHFSGDLILLTHLLMNGRWHIYRTGERWFRARRDMRVVVGTDKYVAVGFCLPVAEFHTAKSLAEAGVSRIGPDVLAADFDVLAVAERLKSRPALEVGDALLDQSILAGIGNVFKSEICYACGVHPFRLVGALSEETVLALVKTARKFLQANVVDGAGDQIVTYMGWRRTTGRSDPTARLWVYGRRGEPCRRCLTAIEARKQGPAARITFWCPTCQPYLAADSRRFS